MADTDSKQYEQPDHNALEREDGPGATPDDIKTEPEGNGDLDTSVGDATQAGKDKLDQVVNW